MKTITLTQGDSLDILKTLGEGSVDMIVTDPPYGIGFMSKDWDRPWKSLGIEYDNEGQAFEAWNEVWLKEAYRVLKPSSHIYIFSSTRTFHRVFQAMSKVGFQDLNLESWCYSSGFPKSINIEKSMRDRFPDLSDKYKGYGTGLKPAWEPICCGVKK